MRDTAYKANDEDSRFYTSWFPAIQIGLALLFAAASLLGPLLVPRLDRLILIASGFGLLLGLVTLRIGWRAAMEKRPVDYPFAAWSRRILNSLVQPQTVRPSLGKRPARDYPSISPRLLYLGWASLVIGGALVLGILLFCYLTFVIQ